MIQYVLVMHMCGALSPLVALLLQGPIVSFVVDLLKRHPLVKQYPQQTAALLNTAAALLAGTVVCGLDIGTILGLAAAGFASSVTTHEVVSQFTKHEEPRALTDLVE